MTLLVMALLMMVTFVMMTLLVTYVVVFMTSVSFAFMNTRIVLNMNCWVNTVVICWVDTNCWTNTTA
jgi:hypothetical protein